MVRRVFVFVVTLMFGTPVLMASDTELAYKQSAEAEAKAKERRELIEAEIARNQNLPTWAGRYFFGDGLGVNVDLWIAPESGFVFEWHGCLGLYDRNFGKIKSGENAIRLECELPNDPSRGFQGIDTDLLPIRWNERRYLVAITKMTEFCNAINSGLEPRNSARGLFFLREGDEEKSAKGRPLLPENYARFILSGSITTRITHVQPSELLSSKSMPGFKWRMTQARVDVGRAHGVFEGMDLHLLKRDVVVSAKVTKVDERSSEVLFKELVDADMVGRPRVGWKLSTRSNYR